MPWSKAGGAMAKGQRQPNDNGLWSEKSLDHKATRAGMEDIYHDFTAVDAVGKQARKR